MKSLTLSKELKPLNHPINKEQIRNYFESVVQAPSIKEKLILGAHDLTEETRVLYDDDSILLLYSNDQTGTYLSCFNKLQEEVEVTLPLDTIKLQGQLKAYCVLTGEELVVTRNTMILQIPKAGVLLVKLIITA